MKEKGNIIKNKQIYLSDPLKMNDNLETKWYLDRLNNEKITVDELEYPESIFDMMKMRSQLDFTFKELEEILFAMEMEKRATEVEKGNYELHSLEEMKSLLVEMKKNG